MSEFESFMTPEGREMLRIMRLIERLQEQADIALEYQEDLDKLLDNIKVDETF